MSQASGLLHPRSSPTVAGDLGQPQKLVMVAMFVQSGTKQLLQAVAVVVTVGQLAAGGAVVTGGDLVEVVLVGLEFGEDSHGRRPGQVV